MHRAYTPGPWFIKERWQGWSIEGDFSDQRTHHHQKPTLVMANVFGPKVGLSAQEAEGNARLMSAAPDILESLLALVSATQNHLSSSDAALRTFDLNAIEDALTAIGKALGEEKP